jgi:hypothetical protein
MTDDETALYNDLHGTLKRLLKRTVKTAKASDMDARGYSAVFLASTLGIAARMATQFKMKRTDFVTFAGELYDLEHEERGGSGSWKKAEE